MMKSRRRALALAAGALSLTVAATACGSGSADSSPGGNSKGGAAVAAANKLISQHTDMPEFTPPGPPIDASKLAGKTIAIVAIDMRIPAIAQVAKYVQQAAKRLDITTTLYDAKSSASSMQQGMQQAINNNADAIISDGLAIKLVANKIKQAKNKGIPTIDVINTPPVRGVPGQGSDPNVFGNVAPDTTLVGKLVASTAIARTDGQAQVAIMNTSEVTVSEKLVQAMKDPLKKCAGCSVVEVTDTALADWSTEIPGLTATTIRRNPNLDFLLPIYDAMGIFATSGVQQAAATGEVHIASFDGTAAALQLVKKGDIFVADVAQNNHWAAWAAVDQAMRGMLGKKPADPILPVRYVSTKQLQDVDVSTPAKAYAALFGDSFKSGYLKLWGVS